MADTDPEAQSMEEMKSFFGRIRLVYRRSSNLSKIVVSVTIVLCMAALLTLSLTMNKMEADTAALQTKAAAIEQKNRDLEEKIRDLGSVQSIQDIAREELGLVNPDSVVFEPES